MAQDEREARVAALVEDNVRTELQVANGAFKLGLSETNIESVMQMVTSSLLYAFELDWSPDWVKPGDVHSWQDDGTWYARCSSCLTDSPGSRSKNEAVTWAQEHEARH